MISAKLIFKLCIYALMLTSLWVPAQLVASETDTPPLTLKQIIHIALEANLDIKAARKETEAAAFAKKSSRAEFYPTLNTTYQYKYNEEEIESDFGTIITPWNEYTFTFSATQPVFSGFAITNQYKITELSLDMAKANKKLVRQDVILGATQAYYEILKAEKLLSVSKETVRQVSAQTDVVRNFYDVGMSPLNDLLESQVLLAEAKQQVVFAKNNLEIARSNMNRLLRRPTHQPIAVVDMLDVAPITYDLDTSIQMALDNRIEIGMSDLEVDLAKTDIELAKRTYYPSVNLQYNYYRFGDDDEWHVNLSEDGFNPDDISVWDIRAIASWNIWDWGKTSNSTREKKSRLSQARIKRDNLKDAIRLSVTQAFLNMQTAEKNIATIETAIEQAQENVRINEERFKEQVATSTDVLTAQTLLARTMNSYYRALYDFNIAKATLYREIGQEYSE